MIKRIWGKVMLGDKMKNYSIFKDNDARLNFASKEINQNMECDILIIGGGLTGISAYYHLNNTDNKIILVEQNEVGMSTTANSTGKITFLQDSIYNKIMKSSKENACLYLGSQILAIKNIVETINTLKLDCDLEETNSLVFTEKLEERDDIYKLQSFLEENKISSKVHEDENKTTIEVEHTYHFNPYKFIYELIQKANLQNIYENSAVQEIIREEDFYRCKVNDYEIKAKRVVVASHYPYFLKKMFFPIKCELEKSYLCAGPKELASTSLISYSRHFVSIRNYQDNMLYLSETHNATCKVDDEEHFKILVSNASEYDLSCEYLWSNTDLLTNDSLPIIGSMSENFLIGTGYNTWGMTNGFLAGIILRDIILEKENKYIKLFNPLRASLNNPLKILEDAFYSARGLILGASTKNDNIEYKNIDGKDVAIYKDEAGEHIVLRKCPHMKCNLIFNEVEKTWDCPCHSSRFDIDGKCISAPANADITFENK